MTSASEYRRWNYRSQYQPKKQVAGVHGEGRCKPFCTNCGSCTHLRLNCTVRYEDE
jgi:hypothetical protein